MSHTMFLPPFAGAAAAAVSARNKDLPYAPSALILHTNTRAPTPTPSDNRRHISGKLDVRNKDSKFGIRACGWKGKDMCYVRLESVSHVCTMAGLSGFDIVMVVLIRYASRTVDSFIIHERSIVLPYGGQHMFSRVLEIEAEYPTRAPNN